MRKVKCVGVTPSSPTPSSPPSSPDPQFPGEASLKLKIRADPLAPDPLAPTASCFRGDSCYPTAMQLKNVRAWMEGKPQPLSLFSIFLALVPDMIYGVSADWYTGCKVLPDFRVGDFERWRRLYWQHRKIGWTLLAYKFPELEGFPYKRYVGDFFNAINTYATTKDKTVLERMEFPDIPKEEFQASLYAYLLEKLEAFAFEHAKCRQEDAGAESTSSMELPLEIVFVFRVWLGCWLVHHESFFPLLMRASKGDVIALEKLVLLDRNVLQARRIDKVWATISEDNESPDFERIRRAMAKQPRLVEYEIYEAKAEVAGLIAKESEALGQPLNASEIGELFDVLARDLARPGQTVHRDPDINRKSDQWRKAVNRKKEKWSKALFFSKP